MIEKVILNNGTSINLNIDFLKKQHALHNKEKIIGCYNTIVDLFLLSIKNKNNIDILQNISIKITEQEFLLQELWNFPKDKNKHSWWWKNPVCTCPKIDNQERLGFGNIYNMSCLIHGLQK